MTDFGPGQFGKILIAIGVFFILLGGLIMLLGKVGLFRLPGDFAYHGKNFHFYFPLASSLLLSAILTFILWLIALLRR